MVEQEPNGAYWLRRVFTVFFLFPHKWGDRQSADFAMAEARDLMRTFQSRMLHDAPKLEKGLTYLNCARMPFKEIDRSVAQHYVGAYFMVEMSEPYDLGYAPGGVVR